jgi:Flp pilus assembly pilin Flp
MRPVRSLEARRRFRRSRGVSTVEYTLLVCLVLAGASPALGALGRKVNAAFATAIARFGE